MQNTSPQDDQRYKNEIADYWNERSLTFDEEIGHGGADRTECLLWQNHFRSILGETSLKVLDVGTGTGFIGLLLAELGHDVTGIDLGDKMLKKAKTKAEKNDLPATFMIGDAEDPDFPANSFDIIICRHVYWTLLQPEETMKRWREILRSGGRAFLIDGKKNPPVEKRPKVYTNVHEGKIYSDELVEKIQGVDVTISEIKETLLRAGFINVASFVLDDIASYHTFQSRRKTGEDKTDSEVNLIVAEAGK